VGKYGIDVEGLEGVGVAALTEAPEEQDLLVIDEIGKMELLSPRFREAVREALEGGRRVLGTIMLAPHPWADEIKRHPRVWLLPVSRENRPWVLDEVRRWLGALGRSGQR
jgi:nucleoside-triphosphatase